jgi:hypothetical protein
MSDSMKYLLVHETTVYVVSTINSHTVHLNSAVHHSFIIKLSTGLFLICQAMLHAICW